MTGGRERVPPEWRESTREAESGSLLPLAQEALKQIQDKNYDTDFVNRGITEIVKYGIAFAGKQVEIAVGTEDIRNIWNGKNKWVIITKEASQ